MNCEPGELAMVVRCSPWANECVHSLKHRVIVRVVAPILQWDGQWWWDLAEPARCPLSKNGWHIQGAPRRRPAPDPRRRRRAPRRRAGDAAGEEGRRPDPAPQAAASRFVNAPRACTRCPEPRTEFDFHKQKGGRNGLHSWCKVCVYAARKARGTRAGKRSWQLQTRYRLTPEKVDAMRVAQGGMCAICRLPMVRECIDHDHATGKVRGLLCHGCNIKLGAIKQTEYRIAAVAYLERHKQ